MDCNHKDPILPSVKLWYDCKHKGHSRQDCAAGLLCHCTALHHMLLHCMLWSMSAVCQMVSGHGPLAKRHYGTCSCMPYWYAQKRTKASSKLIHDLRRCLLFEVSAPQVSANPCCCSQSDMLSRGCCDLVIANCSVHTEVQSWIDHVGLALPCPTLLEVTTQQRVIAFYGGYHTVLDHH